MPSHIEPTRGDGTLEVTRSIHGVTLEVLARTGVRVGSDHALGLFAAHGVRVEPESERVFPDAEHVDWALTCAPRSNRIYGRATEQPVVLEGDNTYVMSGGSSLRVLTLDGHYVPATWEHLRQFNALLDALPHIHICINQVDPQDDAGEGMYRRLAAEMLTGLSKPCLLQASSAGDVAAIIEMGVAIRGSREALAEKPVFMVGCNSEPPLNIPGHIAELMITACQAGIPISLGNYHLMGITAPATVAGAVVQLNAVQLVGVLLSQIVRPGVEIPYTAFCGGGNMRTLDPIASNPTTLQQLRWAAAMGRFYDLPVYGVALTDARMPDGQAACEHALQMQLALGWGVNLIQGFTSMMDQMMLSSFAQAVIDDDIAGCILAARHQPEISAETLALDVMHEVVSDPTYKGLRFAAHHHTAAHLHDQQWQPLAFDYGNFAAWQRAGAPTLVERATTVARDIIARHQPTRLPPEVEDEIRRIADVPGEEWRKVAAFAPVHP